MEATALVRVAAAKSACMSGNSTVSWNKNDKEPSWAWAAIDAGAREAVKDYITSPCESADLVVKYIYNDDLGTVTMTVTDAQSGALVFAETRTVSDLASDVTRMADHWRDMVAEAREAVRAAQLAAAEAERQREEQAKRENHERVCQSEFDSLRQSIAPYAENQSATLPTALANQMTAHNSNCGNFISLGTVKEMEQRDAEAKRIQEEEELEQKRAAVLEKEKADALVAWQRLLASAPFVPPTEGWAEALDLPSIPYYIILSHNTDNASCHFATDNNSRPVLDCLGTEGRNDFFSVKSGARWYLLKSKWQAKGEYAATVKDDGRKMCLRKAGCYTVLAEVRPFPQTLPDLLPVPRPGTLTMKYTSDDFSFAYPQNWQTQDIRNKDHSLSELTVAPPEGHLGSWVTHGFFVGHVKGQSPGSIQAQSGAWNQFSSLAKQRGFAVGDAKDAPVGDRNGVIATYTQPSVFNAPENGWLVVVKDRSEGYYWIVFFYPSNDDHQLYTQTFDAILKSFRFVN